MLSLRCRYKMIVYYIIMVPNYYKIKIIIHKYTYTDLYVFNGTGYIDS